MKKATTANHFLKELSDILPLSLYIITAIVLGIAFMFLDLLNPVTMLILLYGLRVTVVLFACAISIIIILLLKYRSYFCIDIVNSVDAVCVISILTFLIYLVTIYFIGILSAYKGIISVMCAFLLALMEVNRAIRYSKSIKTSDDNMPFISLKEIYENKINNSKEDLVLVDEIAVDYDLLDRGFSINYLYKSIVTCNVNSSHVIGLEGEWGSGKTTLINNAKTMIRLNNKNIKIIDDFDPWSCGSEEALLYSLCEAIDKSIEFRYGFVSNKRLLKQISSIVTNNYITGGIISAVCERFYGNSSFDQLTKLKKRIGDYLKKHNLHIVIVIDNIDRASADNIIFLFKVIGAIFDIPRLTYVLAYDPKRMDSIMSESLKINPKYIEKIVKQVISVPIMQNSRVRTVYSVCFDNLLSYYGLDDKTIEECAFIKEYICHRIADLRQYKRLINSVLSVVTDKSGLCVSDLLAIQVLRFCEYDVYHTIYSNKKFFISSDVFYDRDLAFRGDKESFKREGTLFFDDLSKKASPECMKLLRKLFPFVNIYFEKKELPLYPSINEKIRYNPIYSAKYFELYFAYGSNEFLQISKKVNETISRINEFNNVNDICSIFRENVFCLESSYQQEWIAQFSIREPMLEPGAVESCARAIYREIYSFDDSTFFMMLNSRQIMISFLANLLMKLPEESYNSFIKEIQYDYFKLNIIRSIIYWMETDNISIPKDLVDSYINKIKDFYGTMCASILNSINGIDGIDLYDDTNYYRKNIFGLFNVEDVKTEDEQEETIVDYINYVASCQNIYRILGDIVSFSMGHSYSYYMTEKTMKLFFDDTQKIDEILKVRRPQTESEEFVQRVYDNYKNGCRNDMDDNVIIKNEEVNLIL